MACRARGRRSETIEVGAKSRDDAGRACDPHHLRYDEVGWGRASSDLAVEILAIKGNLQEALLVQSILRGSGIEVFIPDEFTVQNDWGLINAIGGIRILIASDKLEEARQILGSDNDALE